MVAEYEIRSSHVHLLNFFYVFLLVFPQIDYDAPVYPCYFNSNYMVSCKEKQKVNIRMETTILEMLKDLEQRHSYLHNYWYTLRYFVCSLHAVYRLLFKVLHVFGNASMASKLKCHNLQDGPRPIQENLKLFKELVVFNQIQTQIIGAILRGNLNPLFQDSISKIFFRLMKFLNNIIWFDNRTENVLHNG